MNHTKIILALALLVLFLYTASAAPIGDSNSDIPAGNEYFYITSDPSGADVYITDSKSANVYYGKTPLGTFVSEGNMKVVVKMAGYEDYVIERIAVYGSALWNIKLEKSDANADGNGTTGDSNTSDSNGTADTRYSICTDTDGGINYYVKGDLNTLTYDKNEPTGGDRNGTLIGEGNVSDFCTSLISGQVVLTEYYCGISDIYGGVANNVSYLSYNCETKKGYKCSAGACISTSTTAYGKIKVTSSPSKADVYVDGRYAGITPLSLSEVSVGTHTVEVKLKNYNPYKKSIKVSKNRTTPVSAKLTKISTKKSKKTARTK